MCTASVVYCEDALLWISAVFPVVQVCLREFFFNCVFLTCVLRNLKTVDRFGDLTVTGFVTASRILMIQ